MSLRGIALILAIAGSLPICFFRPFYGVMLWTILAFLNPQRLTWGSTDTFPFAAAVGVATIAGFLLFNRGWVRRLASPQVILLGVLWTWFAITSIVSTHTPMLMHHSSETWFRFQFVSKILIMTLILIGLVDSFARLRVLVIAIAGSFAFFVLKALPFIVLTGGTSRVFGPEYSMIGDNNDFGLALNMTVPLFFGLAQTEPGHWSRRFWGFVFIASIPVIFFTYSRGALVGLAAVMVLMLLQAKQRLIIVPVLIVAMAIGFLFTPTVWRERMDPTRENAVDSSARSRLNAWAFCWALAAEFPVVGGGFETFTPELFQRYAPNAADVHGSHSVYFGVLAEHGFVGLALYLILLGSCFITNRRVAKRARLHEDPLISNYSNMFGFSLIGFLTSGLFLGRAYFDYFFTIVACIVILNRITREDLVTERFIEFEAAEVA